MIAFVAWLNGLCNPLVGSVACVVSLYEMWNCRHRGIGVMTPLWFFAWGAMIASTVIFALNAALHGHVDIVDVAICCLMVWVFWIEWRKRPPRPPRRRIARAAAKIRELLENLRERLIPVPQGA